MLADRWLRVSWSPGPAAVGACRASFLAEHSGRIHWRVLAPREDVVGQPTERVNVRLDRRGSIWQTAKLGRQRCGCHTRLEAVIQRDAPVGDLGFGYYELN